ncbi:MAG: glycosyltransferase, partial [Acidimicrobiia bacterium]|nr:glycosyltransferase [Acidimicrobiia bacterium]
RGLEEPDTDWLFDRLAKALDEGFDREPITDISASVERAAAAVLAPEVDSVALPQALFPILVASLANAATANGELEKRLANAQRERTELGNYLNDRVAELQAVRSEFQAFRDARAVKLAQLAWDGRRMATEAVSTLRQRIKNPEPEVEIKGQLSISDIVAANTGSAGFVVFAPSIHWNVELFQRPQQMALAFARQGHTVLYQVDEQYRNGLTGYRPVGERIYEGYLEPDRYDELDQIPDPLFLSYVYNYAWGRNLTNAHAVYEHIDDLEVFEQVYGRHDLDRWHTEALHNADVVVGSAVDLLADLTPVRPDALLVPNGVDVDHFLAEDRPIPEDISDLVSAGTPIIGYYGALAEWFDYGLLEQLAERLDDHAFVLIGPDYDGTLPRSEVTGLANVHWLGPKPYATLPAYLDRFAVATIPFVVNDVTHSVSPLKLFEYMAGGKPVITPPLRECARYPEVLLADGVDEWAAMITLAIELGADDSFRRRMIAAAERNTWDARVKTILDAVQVSDDR